MTQCKNEPDNGKHGARDEGKMQSGNRDHVHDPGLCHHIVICFTDAALVAGDERCRDTADPVAQLGDESCRDCAAYVVDEA